MKLYVKMLLMIVESDRVIVVFRGQMENPGLVEKVL